MIPQVRQLFLEIILTAQYVSCPLFINRHVVQQLGHELDVLNRRIWLVRFGVRFAEVEPQFWMTFYSSVIRAICQSIVFVVANVADSRLHENGVKEVKNGSR